MNQEDALTLLKLQAPFSLDELEAAYEQISNHWGRKAASGNRAERPQAKATLAQLRNARELLKPVASATTAKAAPPPNPTAPTEQEQLLLKLCILPKLNDQILSRHEEDEIQRMGQQMGLTPSRIQALIDTVLQENQARRQSVEDTLFIDLVIAPKLHDRILDPHEEDEIMRVGRKQGLTAPQIQTLIEQQLHYHQARRAAESQTAQPPPSPLETNTLKIQTGQAVKLESCLSRSTRASLWKAQVDNRKYVLKQLLDPERAATIQTLQRQILSDSRLLWPKELVTDTQQPLLAYLMNLLPTRFVSLTDMPLTAHEYLWSRLSLAIALAEVFEQLLQHELVFAHCEANHVWVDPTTGDVRLLALDNLVFQTRPAHMTPANLRQHYALLAEADPPELLQGQNWPDLATMSYQLGALLKTLLSPADTVLPQAVVLKNCLSISLNRATGPAGQRLHPKQWLTVLRPLRDAIAYCPHCQSENLLQINIIQKQYCITCSQTLHNLYALKLPTCQVLLHSKTRILASHLDSSLDSQPDQVLAQVIPHPREKGIWGLENLTRNPWKAHLSNGDETTVPPKQRLRIHPGYRFELLPGIHAEVRRFL